MTTKNIEQLWLEYHPKVYGYFFRRVNNRLDVEDLTSITLEVFMDNILNPNKQIQNTHGFLWKIAHNQLLVFINTKTKKPIPVSLNEDLENYRPTEITIENQSAENLNIRKQKLLECVQNQLSSEEIDLVEKIIMEDQKAVNLAVELNLKPENIRQKLSRSLKKLREHCRQVWEN